MTLEFMLHYAREKWPGGFKYKPLYTHIGEIDYNNPEFDWTKQWHDKLYMGFIIGSNDNRFTYFDLSYWMSNDMRFIYCDNTQDNTKTISEPAIFRFISSNVATEVFNFRNPDPGAPFVPSLVMQPHDFYFQGYLFEPHETIIT